MTAYQPELAKEAHPFDDTPHNPGIKLKGEAIGAFDLGFRTGHAAAMKQILDFMKRKDCKELAAAKEAKS